MPNRYFIQTFFFFLLRATALLVVLVLFSILAFLLWKGIGVINWTFLTDIPREGTVG